MNLIKIGAYIAAKRKALGMTQLDLAKQLGMSDKSVSKWERGICLPDVSIYIQLCEILGISINEFIAGEDLDTQKLPKQAEENILVVANEGDRRRKKLQRILIVLSVIYFFVAFCMMLQESVRYRECIGPVPEYSTEMQLVEAICDEDSVYLYNYDLDNSFSSIAINLTIYQRGSALEKRTIASYRQNGMRTAGIVAIIPGSDERIKVIITEGDGKIFSEIPILKGVSNKDSLRRTVSKMTASKDVKKGDEIALVSFIYSEGEMVSQPLESVINGEKAKDNDYMYLFTAEFQ